MSDKKTPWNDVSFIWKKIAGVIAAVGVLATLVVKIFNTDPTITYIAFAFLGLILLMISWYVDKQAEYTHKEVVEVEKKAREDFATAIKETRSIVNQNKEDTENRINGFKDQVSNIESSMQTILSVAEDTRKDTLRIQLMMLMKEEENNIDTILKVAETYFVELQGDWYMTSEFSKWAKRHDVVIPDNIWGSIKGHIDK